MGWLPEWLDEYVLLCFKSYLLITHSFNFSAREAFIAVYESDYASLHVNSERSTRHANLDANPLYDFNHWRKRFQGARSSAYDVIDAYLREPVVDYEDPIAFWLAERAAGHRPQLAQMAIDYLTIPCKCFTLLSVLFSLRRLLFVAGASVDVERAFSRGRRAISLYRHSLSDSTARASIVFGSWVAAEVVPQDVLINATRDLRSRLPLRKSRKRPTASLQRTHEWDSEDDGSNSNGGDSNGGDCDDVTNLEDVSDVEDMTAQEPQDEIIDTEGSCDA